MKYKDVHHWGCFHTWLLSLGIMTALTPAAAQEAKVFESAQDQDSYHSGMPQPNSVENTAAPDIKPNCVEADISDFNQNAEWMTLLGFMPLEDENTFAASANTYKDILALSQDPALDKLIALFEEYLGNSSVAEQDHLDDAIDKMFETPSLNQMDKIRIFLTLKPFLLDHARNSGDMIASRKLQDKANSMQRLWNQQFDIVCADNTRVLRFPVSLLVEGTKVWDGLLEAQKCNGTQLPQALTCKTYATDVLGWDNSLEHSLEDALWALNQKDNEFTILAMGQLGRVLKRRQADDGTQAIQDANTLCQFQTIEMLALEQTRFAELAALEQALQHASGTSFYDRLKLQASCKLEGNFASTFARLKNDHASSLKWLSDNFDPKKGKKRSKAVSAWLKKGTKYVRFSRRMWASWTAWSLGDYVQAAEFAGDVMEGKTRLVHPQLYSYDLMLKAIRRDFPPLENLQTYTRLMNLKSPALVYQTLSQAARWLTPSEKKSVVEAVVAYSPSQASSVAADFYMAYREQLRARMSPSHRVAVDAWLDTELASTLSDAENHQHRMVWLGDAIEARLWGQVQTIAETADHSTPKNAAYWCQISNHALEVQGKQAVESCMACADLDACASGTGEAWFKSAMDCYDRITCD